MQPALKRAFAFSDLASDDEDANKRSKKSSRPTPHPPHGHNDSANDARETSRPFSKSVNKSLGCQNTRSTDPPASYGGDSSQIAKEMKTIHSSGDSGSNLDRSTFPKGPTLASISPAHQRSDGLPRVDEPQRKGVSTQISELGSGTTSLPFIDSKDSEKSTTLSSSSPKSAAPTSIKPGSLGNTAQALPLVSNTVTKQTNLNLKGPLSLSSVEIVLSKENPRKQKNGKAIVPSSGAGSTIHKNHSHSVGHEKLPRCSEVPRTADTKVDRFSNMRQVERDSGLGTKTSQSLMTGMVDKATATDLCQENSHTRLPEASRKPSSSELSDATVVPCPTSPRKTQSTGGSTGVFNDATQKLDVAFSAPMSSAVVDNEHPSMDSNTSSMRLTHLPENNTQANPRLMEKRATDYKQDSTGDAVLGPVTQFTEVVAEQEKETLGASNNHEGTKSHSDVVIELNKSSYPTTTAPGSAKDTVMANHQESSADVSLWNRRAESSSVGKRGASAAQPPCISSQLSQPPSASSDTPQSIASIPEFLSSKGDTDTSSSYLDIGEYGNFNSNIETDADTDIHSWVLSQRTYSLPSIEILSVTNKELVGAHMDTKTQSKGDASGAEVTTCSSPTNVHGIRNYGLDSDDDKQSYPYKPDQLISDGVRNAPVEGTRMARTSPSSPRGTCAAFAERDMPEFSTNQYNITVKELDFPSAQRHGSVQNGTCESLVKAEGPRRVRQRVTFLMLDERQNTGDGLNIDHVHTCDFKKSPPIEALLVPQSKSQCNSEENSQDSSSVAELATLERTISPTSQFYKNLKAKQGLSVAKANLHSCHEDLSSSSLSLLSPAKAKTSTFDLDSKLPSGESKPAPVTMHSLQTEASAVAPKILVKKSKYTARSGTLFTPLNLSLSLQTGRRLPTNLSEISLSDTEDAGGDFSKVWSYND